VQCNIEMVIFPFFSKKMLELLQKYNRILTINQTVFV